MSWQFHLQTTVVIFEANRVVPRRQHYIHVYVWLSMYVTWISRLLLSQNAYLWYAHHKNLVLRIIKVNMEYRALITLYYSSPSTGHIYTVL